MEELAAAEGVQVHHSSIADLLSRLGFTYKKVAPSRQHSFAVRLPINGVATERRRAKVRQQRAERAADAAVNAKT